MLLDMHFPEQFVSYAGGVATDQTITVTQSSSGSQSTIFMHCRPLGNGTVVVDPTLLVAPGSLYGGFTVEYLISQPRACAAAVPRAAVSLATRHSCSERGGRCPADRPDFEPSLLQVLRVLSMQRVPRRSGGARS